MNPTNKLTIVSKSVSEPAYGKGPFGYLSSGLSIVGLFNTLAFLAVISTGTAWPQTGNSSVIQTVTVEVKPITRLSVSGNPGALVINDAVPASDILSVSDAGTQYSLITNLDNMKIVASINDNMPAGTKLMARLSSSKATSTGLVDLSGALSPVDVVTGLSRASDLNQSISYTFAANSDIYEIPVQSRTVTLTLTN